MAISFIQKTTGGAENDFTPDLALTTSDFSSSVASGNLIIVGVRGYTSVQALGLTSITDTLGTSYTQVLADTTQDPFLWVYYGVLSSSGTNAVTATFSSTGQNPIYGWVAALEYSGQATSPYDASVHGNGTGTTDCIIGGLTTTAAGVVVAFVSQNSAQAYTVGADYTLRDGNIGGASLDFGGVEDYITSGNLSSYTSHIASDGSTNYTMAAAAFKAAGGAITSPTDGYIIIRQS
jgi:hypothetical protein